MLLPNDSKVWGKAIYFHVCILSPICKLTILIFPDLEFILEATVTLLLHQLRPHFSPQYAKRYPFFTFYQLQWIDFIMSWIKTVPHYTFFPDVF